MGWVKFQILVARHLVAWPLSHLGICLPRHSVAGHSVAGHSVAGHSVAGHSVAGLSISSIFHLVGSKSNSDMNV
jgi:hypothetical protein